MGVLLFKFFLSILYSFFWYSGNGRLCSLGGMIGFVVMMALDVGLS